MRIHPTASLFERAVHRNFVARVRSTRRTILGVLAGSIVSAKLLVRPVVSVENALVVPVELRVEGFGERTMTLRPNETWSAPTIAIPYMRWTALDPATGRPLQRGVLRAGEFEYPAIPFLLQRLVLARYKRKIDRRIDSVRFVAPVIDNDSNDTLRVALQRLDGARWSCACMLLPGAAGYVAGYFPVTGGLQVTALRRNGQIVGTWRIAESSIENRNAVRIRVHPRPGDARNRPTIDR